MSDYFLRINKSVSETLLHQNEVVLRNVVDSLVKEKLEDRKKLVIRAVHLIRDLQVKKDGIHPTNQAFDRSGNLLSESYSADQISKLNLIQQHIKSVDAALALAFEKADYDTLTLTLSDAEKLK